MRILLLAFLLVLSGCSAPAPQASWQVDADAGSADAVPARGPFAPGDTLVYRLSVRDDHAGVTVGIGYQSLRLLTLEENGTVEHWATHIEDGYWSAEGWTLTQRILGSVRVRASDGAYLDLSSRAESWSDNGTWGTKWTSRQVFDEPCVVRGDLPGLALGASHEVPCGFRALRDEGDGGPWRNGTATDVVQAVSADVVEVPAGRFDAVRLHVVRGDQSFDRWLSGDGCGEVLSLEAREDATFVTELFAASVCGSGTAPPLPDEVPFNPAHSPSGGEAGSGEEEGERSGRPT